MYQGDDLTTFWGLIAVALPFAFEARRETGWRCWLFWGVTGSLALCAVFWWLVKAYAPPVSDFITARATNGESWFILFMFVMVLIAISGKQKPGDIKNEADPQSIVDWDLWKRRKNYTARELPRILAKSEPTSDKLSPRGQAIQRLIFESMKNGALPYIKEPNGRIDGGHLLPSFDTRIVRASGIKWAEDNGIDVSHIK